MRWCGGIVLSALLVASLSGCIATPSGIDSATAGARQGITIATSAVADDESLSTDPTAWLATFRTNGGFGASLRDGTATGFVWSVPQDPVAFRAAARGTTPVLDVISAGVGYNTPEPVQVIAYVCARIVVDPGPRLTARATELPCPADIVAAARLQTATAVPLNGHPTATWTPQPPVSPPGG